jgi:hypothetical protein
MATNGNRDNLWQSKRYKQSMALILKRMFCLVFNCNYYQCLSSFFTINKKSKNKAIQDNTRQFKAIQDNTRQFKAIQGKREDILPVIIVNFKCSHQFL